MTTTFSPPRIVCAANRIARPYPFVDHIVIGPRHFDQMMHVAIQIGVESGRWNYSDWFEAEQGFIDQFGSFHTRQEAYIIAEREKQIRHIDGGPIGSLYSEHLY